jgi:PAS domain S-box-containing protein
MKPGLHNFLRKIKFEYRITFTYLVFGFLWILFSDKVLDLLQPDDSLLTEFQTFKGSFFIVVTSGFLYLFVKGHMQKLRTNEAQRIEGESHYKALFNDNLSVILLLNPDTGKIEDANQAASNYYGWPHDELCKKSVYDINTLNAEQINERLAAIKAEMLNHNVFQHRLANGEVRDVEVYTGPIRFGNKTRLYSHIHDITEQKSALEIIRKNDEKFRNTLDQMLEGCQIIGPDWKYLYLNRTAEVHNRRPNKDLLGEKYMDRWPGIEETEVFSLIKHTLEKGVPHHIENEFVFPDREIGWFDLSIQPVPEGVFILSIDISERKKAEKAQRESEEKYRLISDNSDDWIYWITPEGHIKYVSPACERVTGYSPAEFVYHPELIHEIVLDTEQEKFRQHTLITEQEETAHNLEFRIITKNGEIRWISHSCSPIFGTKGEYLGRRGTNRNITERKQQEAQLYESEFRFNRLYEDGPFGMMMVNQEFQYENVNPTFCKILGYSETELKQLTFKDISYPEDLVNDVPNIRKLINKEISVYKTEKRYICKDGHVIWGALTVTANYDKEGQFLYNLAIVEDITRRKQVEEDLRKSKKLLSETESIGRVGGWELNIDSMDQTWTEEVYRIHEVDFNFNPNIDKGISFYTPESRPVVEAAVQRAMQLGESFDLELEIITAKGNHVKVHTIGIPDLENHRIYGFFQDITDRMQAEEELRMSEAKFRAVAESSPIAIYASSGSDQKAIYINEAFYKIFGFSMEDVPTVGHWWIKAFPDENYRQQVIDQWTYNIEQAAINHKDVEALECACTCKDGSEKIIVWAGKTIADEFWAFGYDITEPKLAEAELRERENKLSTIFNLLPVGISILDQDQQIVYQNPALENILGITKEGLQHSDYRNRKYLRSDGTQKPAEEFASARVFSEKTAQQYCITGIVKEDGYTVWTNVSAVPVEFPDWKVVIVTSDITSQKLIEQELQESEEYLKLGYETANMGIWKNDLRTMTVEFDEQARVHYGFDNSVVSLSDVIARIHPDDKEKLVAEIEKATSPSGTGEYTTEYRVIQPDGSVHWLFIGVRIIYEGEGENRRSIMGYGTSLDITERKQKEESLKKLEYFLSESQRIAHMGSFEYVVDTQATYWSAEEYSIYGLDPKGPSPTYEVMLAKCIHPEEAALLNQTFVAAIKSHSVYELEHRIIKPDGSIRWVYDRALPYFDHDGKLVRYVGATLDITERKQAEEHIRTLNNELEQRVLDRTSLLEAANKELEAFSYSVSHDLRAPLRHINGYVDLLKGHYHDQLPEKGKHYLDTIQDSSLQMGTLIDDLLQFSRTGRQEMHKSDVDMNLILQDVLNSLKNDTEDRKINWQIDKLPLINGDNSMLRQVWFNLLSNAVKFTRQKKIARIHIKAEEDKNEYAFSVSDNGAGFDMQYAQKLFGVFQRLHSQKDFEGTGIGLANVRRIILKHGGRTWAESKPGQGAKFYFTIPKNKEA